MIVFYLQLMFPMEWTGFLYERTENIQILHRPRRVSTHRSECCSQCNEFSVSYWVCQPPWFQYHTVLNLFFTCIDLFNRGIRCRIAFGWVYLGVKTYDFFLCFLPLFSWTILHSIVSVPLFILFYITREFGRFLHLARAVWFFYFSFWSVRHFENLHRRACALPGVSGRVRLGPRKTNVRRIGERVWSEIK